MIREVLVVGAGFSGSVVAERLAASGVPIRLIEKRDHVGGNAYDEFDQFGVLVHRYGPHVFHTNAARIHEYLSRFTEWIPYEHRVLSAVDDLLLPFPINRRTINSLYNLQLDEEELRAFFEKIREKRETIKNSEDVVLSTVGRELCDKFYRGYTLKQWGLDLASLGPEVAGRVKVRLNDDDRYFEDSFQGIPRNGYTAMFKNMLDHPLISLELATDYKDVKHPEAYAHIVYTGPIDQFFGLAYGSLPYRSLRFEFEHFSRSRYQSVGTVNFPNAYDFTRVTEFKHLTGQQHPGTTIVREYPFDGGEEYYPVPTVESRRTAKMYTDLAASSKGVTLVGRLAQYRYYNMDQAVAAALSAATTISMKRI